jgi:mono/diheme cytochrome c family protein
MITVVLLLCAFAAGRPDAGQAAKPAPPKPSAPAKPAAEAEDNYKALCVPCHGPEGKGLIPAMSFTDGVWKHGSTVAAVSQTISNGAKGTLMLPFKEKLSKAEIQALAKYVRQFDPALKPTKPSK